MKIGIKKIKELEDALHPHNIHEGFETIRETNELWFKEPTVGERFKIGSFWTSEVKEVIDSKSFRTHNSIYEWEIIEEKELDSEESMKIAFDSIEWAFDKKK
jgi:hypothetical protein